MSGIPACILVLRKRCVHDDEVIAGFFMSILRTTPGRHASVVDRSKNVEGRLHNAFEKYRVNRNREFFEITPESVLEMVEIRDVTPSEAM